MPLWMDVLVLWLCLSLFTVMLFSALLRGAALLAEQAQAATSAPPS